MPLVCLKALQHKPLRLHGSGGLSKTGLMWIGRQLGPTVTTVQRIHFDLSIPALSACAEFANKGVNQCSKDVTQKQ